MKFKNQVTSAVKKANKTLGMIKRNFEYITYITKDLYGYYIYIISKYI